MKHKILILCLSFLSICGVAFANGGTTTSAKSGLSTWGAAPLLVNTPPNFYGTGKKCGLVSVTRSTTHPTYGFIQATKTVFFCGPVSSPCTCKSAAFLSLQLNKNPISVNIVNYCLQFGTCP